MSDYFDASGNRINDGLTARASDVVFLPAATPVKVRAKASPRSGKSQARAA